jgi:glycosyltransferase involved in cell wall biosynthesis
MKIAVVHEWLVDWAGSEQVLQQILLCYPDADVFTLADFLPPHLRDRILNKVPTTSFLQHAPFARRALWKYLPLMPLAIRGLDLSRHDLVISSSHCVAKGVVTRPDQLHLSYVHSPMRYAWDLEDQYLQSGELDGPVRRYVARQIFRYLRNWDVHTARNPAAIAANSNFVAQRIRRVWNRESRVIFPPVDTDRFVPANGREDFFLCASRLQFYKRVDVVVDAFASLPAQRLVVIGAGPERQRLESMAPKNVTFLGYQDDRSLLSHVQRAKALIFAAEEDFGILPVEAQACGTPVIAFGKGGALETVRGPEQPRATGVFFQRQDPDAVRDAVRLFLADESRYTGDSCRANAMQFSAERFRKEFREFVDEHQSAAR